MKKDVKDYIETMKIKEKVMAKAPAIGIYNVLKEKHGYIGKYSNIKAYVHNLKRETIICYGSF